MRKPSPAVVITALTVSAAIFTATPGSALADSGTAADTATDQGTQLSQPFLAWGDTAEYELAPDGDFAAGLSGWTTSGDAGLLPEADPWSLTGGTQSLELPAGSSATSPAASIDADEPTIRFFTANRGDPSSRLSVSVSFPTLAGLSVTLPIDTITAGASWQPSPVEWTTVNLLAGAGSIPVQFTFTPIGDGDWHIDDLYIDPWGRT